MKTARIVNLDLYRALAILFVLFFHTTQMFAGENVNADYYLWGKFGVEFFFVLSGFLVGGLFYKQADNVNLLKFWLLRFFRTYPPYIIALLLSYFAVYFSRAEQFNFGYLIFIQNFYTTIPYFKISWSLCIEEHFYLFFPFIILLSEKVLKKSFLQLGLWITLCLLPTFFRWKFGSIHPENFGYFETASYFRFEGIAMGCLLSFIIYRYNINLNFSFLAKTSIYLFFILMLFINVVFKNFTFTYTIGYLLFNVSLLLLLAVFYFGNNFILAGNLFVKTVASMAYSLYLTHALTINFMSIVANKFKTNLFLMYSITFIVILIIGFIFYRLVERPTIKARNYFLMR